MLALNAYAVAEPRTRRRVHASTLKRPAKVLVGYSAIEKVDHGEARDLETDLETIDTAKTIAKNLRKAGFDADTYIVYTLRDIDRLIEKHDPDDLLFFNLCEHLQGRGPVRGDTNLVAPEPEQLRQGLGGVGVVLDDDPSSLTQAISIAAWGRVRVYFTAFESRFCQT